MAPSSVLNKVLDRVQAELAKHEMQIASIKPLSAELKSKFETRLKQSRQRNSECSTYSQSSLPTLPTSPTRDTVKFATSTTRDTMLQGSPDLQKQQFNSRRNTVQACLRGNN